MLLCYLSVGQEEIGLEEDSYEICYNNACYQIGCGNLEAAMEKLKKAEGLSELFVFASFLVFLSME